jgi:hypothetical protein
MTQKYLIVTDRRTSIGIVQETGVVSEKDLKNYCGHHTVYPVEKALTTKQKAKLGMVQ